MNAIAKNRIAKSLRQLATSYAQTMQSLDESLKVLSIELKLEEIAPSVRLLEPDHQLSKGSIDRPIADRGTLSVCWKGRSCFLGNTLPFRFIEQLLCRPNRYLSCDELLEVVWEGRRSVETIRSTVKVLRRKLSQAGMAQLAEAIHAQRGGHYGIILMGRV